MAVSTPSLDGASETRITPLAERGTDLDVNPRGRLNAPSSSAPASGGGRRRLASRRRLRLWGGLPLPVQPGFIVRWGAARVPWRRGGASARLEPSWRMSRTRLAISSRFSLRRPNLRRPRRTCRVRRGDRRPCRRCGFDGLVAAPSCRRLDRVFVPARQQDASRGEVTTATRPPRSILALTRLSHSAPRPHPRGRRRDGGGRCGGVLLLLCARARLGKHATPRRRARGGDSFITRVRIVGQCLACPQQATFFGRRRDVLAATGLLGGCGRRCASRRGASTAASVRSSARLARRAGRRRRTSRASSRWRRRTCARPRARIRGRLVAPRSRDAARAPTTPATADSRRDVVRDGQGLRAALPSAPLDWPGVCAAPRRLSIYVSPSYVFPRRPSATAAVPLRLRPRGRSTHPPAVRRRREYGAAVSAV